MLLSGCWCAPKEWKKLLLPKDRKAGDNRAEALLIAEYGRRVTFNGRVLSVSRSRSDIARSLRSASARKCSSSDRMVLSPSPARP